MKSPTISTIALSLFVGASAFIPLHAAEPPADVASVLAEAIHAVQSAPLAEIPALPLKEYEIPHPSIDVMRVKMDETYVIEGIGSDTVELTGWIAVAHFAPRTNDPTAKPEWNNAVVPTQFLAMELTGQSQIFGPVRVHIDPDKRVYGEVGQIEIPFVTGVVANLCYREHRSTEPSLAEAPYLQTKLPIELAAETGRIWVQAASKDEANQKKDVENVLRSVLQAISDKDLKKMEGFYSDDPDSEFFGPGSATSKGLKKKDYFQSLANLYKNIKTIKSTPNKNIDVQIFGNAASATVTGVNDVVDIKDRRDSAPWRWTVQLEQKNGRWEIHREHLSFIQISPSGDRMAPPPIKERAAKCLAQVSVGVSLQGGKMALQLETPIQWYSEVKTIPPVGTTTSVSLAPSRLMLSGRPAGTLSQGIVKFREVIFHKDIDDSPTDAKTVAR